MINRAAQNIPQYVKLFSKTMQCSSAQKELINAPSEEFISNRQALKKNTWRDLDPTGLVLLIKFRNLKPLILVTQNNSFEKCQS